MKKLAMSVAVLAVVSMGYVGVAFAQNQAITPADCPVDGNHRVFDSDNSTIVGCISDATWDAGMTAGKVDSTKLPVTPPGSSVTDDHGISATCSKEWSCVNIMHTSPYVTSLENIARQLIGLELSTTRFNGWIAAVK